VGTVFAVAPVGVVGVNDRLFVRLIVRLVPVETYGTVITTGDQVAGTGGVAVGLPTEYGFNAAQVAVAPVAAVPQK
jgi:hypothetical protein